MRKLSVLLCLLLPAVVFSQTLTNTLLGFQEPYTQIKGQCTDENGNVYYAGIFRSSLTVNNQLLFTGNGGDDLFLIKTNSSGAIRWAKKYGSEGNELMPNGNLLKYNNGNLYFSNYITYPTDIGGIQVQPYGFDKPASCLSKVDTANGNVLWVKKSSLIINSLLVNGNTVLASGTHSENRGSLLYNDQLLLDSASVQGIRQVFIFLNSNGTFVTWKSTRQTVIQNGVTSYSASTLYGPQLSASGSLFFLVRGAAGNGGGSLFLQDSLINFPANQSQILVVKTDSSFRRISYRVLNPSGAGVSLITNSTALMTTLNPAGDSLYMLLTIQNPFTYTLDGFNLALTYRNNLLVMDSNLVTGRIANLNSTIVNGQNGKLFLNSIHYYNGSLYYTGYVRGANEAPALIPIPQQWTNVDMIAGFVDTFDVNGPTRSFVAKTNLGLNQRTRTWMPSSPGYESSGPLAGSFVSGSGKLHFNLTTDDLWNPWTLDTALNLIRGSLIPNSDRAESTKTIKYFSDATKFVLGFAKAKTALDNNNNGIISSATRSDLFFVRVGAQDNVIWYKRIFSSFRFATIKKVVVKNDKAYVLAQFGSPVNGNGYNYIKIDSTTITVPNQVHIAMFIIDRSGRSRVLDMYSTTINNAGTFDVYPNGDLLISNESGANPSLTFGGNTYPTGLGVYIAKLDSLGNTQSVLKCYSPGTTFSPRATDIMLHPDATTFSLLGIVNMPINTSSFKLILTNAASFRDTMTAVNPEISNPVSRAFAFLFRTSFTQKNHFSFAGPISNMAGPGNMIALVGDKVYAPMTRSNIKDSFYINNQLIYNDTSTNLYTIVGFDERGNYKTHKILSVPQGISFPAVNAQKLTAAGNYIYATGTLNRATSVDTIQLGYAGASDAIALKLDTNLVARQAFRLSSIYSESMMDCDVYNDSLISFAYMAQSTPAYSNNRLQGDPADLDEDAYVGTILMSRTVISGNTDPARARVYPNPAAGQQLWINLGDAPADNYRWSLLTMSGQSLTTGTLNWTAGQSRQITVPATLPPGMYILFFSNASGSVVKKLKLVVGE